MATPGKNKVSEKEIYDYLMTKPGMTDVKAQGILANIKAESNLNPGIGGDYMIADPTGKLKNKERLVYQKSDGKYYYSEYHPTKKDQEVDASLVEGIENTSGGLFQHQGSRFDAMVAEIGDDWETNWKGQIDYALSEPEYQKFDSENYDNVVDSTKSFMINFENPADQSDKAITKRVQNIIKDFTIEDLKARPNMSSEEYKQFLNKSNFDNIIKRYNKDITEKSVLGTIKGMYFDADGNKATKMYDANGNKLSDAQGAELFYQNLEKTIANELGFEGELTEGQKREVDLYIHKSQEYIKDNRSGNRSINKLLKKTGIKNTTGGLDSFIEDILEDSDFNDQLDRSLIPANNKNSKNLYKQYQIAEFKSKYKSNQLYNENGELKTNDELELEIVDLKKELEKEKNKRVGIGGTGYNPEKIETLKNIIKEKQDYLNSPASIENFVPKGEFEKINDYKPTKEQLDNAQMGPEEPPSDIQGEYIKDAGIPTEDNVVDNTVNNNDDNNQTTPNETIIKQGPLDAIGGIGTVVSALVGAKALSKASQDPEILATPELSDAFNAELYQMEQLSKQGFAPEQERAIRKDIQSAYDLGVENAIRGTAGDRAKFLAMTGALDTRRQSALLDFAAKDEAARQANRDKYRQMLSFKETYDRQNDMQIRAEKMQQAQLQQQTSSALGAAAIKTALDNIQGAKADMMQRQYIASLSNGVKTEKVGLFESLGLGKLENMFKKNNTEA